MGFAVSFTALFKIDPVNKENIKSPEKATFFISYFSKQSDNANVILKPVTFALQMPPMVGMRGSHFVIPSNHKKSTEPERT